MLLWILVIRVDKTLEIISKQLSGIFIFFKFEKQA